MTYQHRDLAAGRWKKFSFVKQMAHIGSEVERAISWRAKGNKEYAKLAFERALELIDLTLRLSYPEPKLKELARVRAVLVDDFAGTNQFGSTDRAWSTYFLTFATAARMNVRLQG